MAVSNSIGSNVFDILIGLGLPWTLQTLAIDYGSTIHLNSKGLIFSVGLLLASVFLTVLGVHLNKWKLDKRLGFICLLMYAVFLCFSILIEFNIFTFVNLPTCREEWDGSFSQPSLLDLVRTMAQVLDQRQTGSRSEGIFIYWSSWSFIDPLLFFPNGCNIDGVSGSVVLQEEREDVCEEWSRWLIYTLF